MNEFAWLIERHYDSVLHYWDGRFVDTSAWTLNPYEAVRFARREDAERVLSWLLSSVGNCVQHGFSSPNSVSPEAPRS